MIGRRVISAALALAVSSVGLILTASKTKDEIVEAENKKKNRRYRIVKKGKAE